MFEALHNDIFCGCDILEFKKWSGNIGKDELAEHVTCGGPVSQAGRYLPDITSEELEKECELEKEAAAKPVIEVPELSKVPEVAEETGTSDETIDKESNETDDKNDQNGSSSSDSTLVIDVDAHQSGFNPSNENKLIELIGKQDRSDIAICLPKGKTNCNCIDYIFQINCAHKDLEYVPTGFSKGIRLFDLRKNYIEELNPFAFDDMMNLRSIHLQNNLLRMIKEKDFKDPVNLVYLYLNFNQIDYIHANAFMNLGKLAYLHLDHNQLSTGDFLGQNF